MSDVLKENKKFVDVDHEVHRGKGGNFIVAKQEKQVPIQNLLPEISYWAGQSVLRYLPSF